MELVAVMDASTGKGLELQLQKYLMLQITTNMILLMRQITMDYKTL